MGDLLTKFGLPIATAIIAFWGAVYKAKLDLKKQIELNQTEIQKVREQCENEIQKIKIQAETQAQLYEKNAQTDLVANIIGSIFSGSNTADMFKPFIESELKKAMGK